MAKLVKFRGIVRDLLAQGVAPTPSAIAKVSDGKYVTPGYYGSGNTLVAGKYSQARAEEMLLAGWLPVSIGRANYRWQPVKRAEDFSEGHPVVSMFRIGDLVRINSARLIEANDLKSGEEYEIVNYEAGWHLDRPDLPEGTTALCLDNGEDGEIMCADDELVLVRPSPEFPLL